MLSASAQQRPRTHVNTSALVHHTEHCHIHEPIAFVSTSGHPDSDATSNKHDSDSGMESKLHIGTVHWRIVNTPSAASAGGRGAHEHTSHARLPRKTQVQASLTSHEHVHTVFHVHHTGIIAASEPAQCFPAQRRISDAAAVSVSVISSRGNDKKASSAGRDKRGMHDDRKSQTTLRGTTATDRFLNSARPRMENEKKKTNTTTNAARMSDMPKMTLATSIRIEGKCSTSCKRQAIGISSSASGEQVCVLSRVGGCESISPHGGRRMWRSTSQRHGSQPQPRCIQHGTEINNREQCRVQGRGLGLTRPLRKPP